MNSFSSIPKLLAYPNQKTIVKSITVDIVMKQTVKTSTGVIDNLAVPVKVVICK